MALMSIRRSFRLSSKRTSLHTNSCDVIDESPNSDDFEVVNFTNGALSPPVTPKSIPLTDVGPEFDEDEFAEEFESFRSDSLDDKQYKKLFDREGRLTDEHALRQVVFRGGVDPAIRQDVWCFLFGVFPYYSTEKERTVLEMQRVSQYYAMKARWTRELLHHFPDFDLYKCDNFIMENRPFHRAKSAISEQFIEEKCETFECSDEVAKLTAKISANRIDCPRSLLHESLKIIAKDVPRTDRSHPYFKDSEDHLLALRDVLMTASIFMPEVGYVQGMNDIMARFLVVFDSEWIAFWCFCYYIQTVQKDFLSNEMLKRVGLVKELLECLDDDLSQYLTKLDVGDLIFCHKWLLLGFQREFAYDDGLRLLEILSSHHLELYTPQGIAVREHCRRLLKENRGTDYAIELLPADCTFDLFVAVAILSLFRNRIFLCNDGSQVLHFINSLSYQLSLDEVLKRAETLFYRYCQKSVTDAFILL